MKQQTIVALLATSAAAQYPAVGSWRPYGTYASNYGGDTMIYSASERVSSLTIFKGNNGCISGLTLK